MSFNEVFDAVANYVALIFCFAFLAVLAGCTPEPTIFDQCDKVCQKAGGEKHAFIANINGLSHCECKLPDGTGVVLDVGYTGGKPR
jgi:hypothetical protein